MISLYNPYISKNTLKNVSNCIRQNWISSKGSYVQKFEKSFSKFTKIKYSISVSNGTCAMHIALLSFRSYYIFKKKHLNKINNLSLNFHPGPPKYRGFGCANYAIYNKDEYYGVTAHIINEKIDKGKILDVKKFKIEKTISLKKLLKLTHNKQVFQLKDLVNKLIEINFEHKKIKKNFKNNYKWSSKLGSKKKLDKFYEIKNTENYKEFKLKVRATKIGNFKPFKIIKGKKIYIQ